MSSTVSRDGTERGGNPPPPLLGKRGDLISGSCGCVWQEHPKLSEGLCLCVLKTTILAWLTSDSVLYLLLKSPLPSMGSVPCDPFNSIFPCLCLRLILTQSVEEKVEAGPSSCESICMWVLSISLCFPRQGFPR